LEEVIALAIRGNPLKFHRLFAGHTGHERYEWALIIIHSASNTASGSFTMLSQEKSRRAGPAVSLFTPASVDDAAVEAVIAAYLL
jgi:hypothetical protein